MLKSGNSLKHTLWFVVFLVGISLFFLSEKKGKIGNVQSKKKESVVAIQETEKSSYLAAEDNESYDEAKVFKNLEVSGGNNLKVLAARANPLDLESYSTIISSLNSCIETQSCPEFKTGDSRNYYYEVVFTKKTFIKKLYHLIRKDPALMTDEIFHRVLELMYEDEDHVRFAAMEILDEYPKSQYAIEAVAQVLKNTISETLVERGIAFIKNKNSFSDPKVVQSVLVQIKNGSQETSQFIAKKSFHFMTEQNLNQFVELLKRLDPKTVNHKLLKNNIKEFMRFRQMV